MSENDLMQTPSSDTEFVHRYAQGQEFKVELDAAANRAAGITPEERSFVERYAEGKPCQQAGSDDSNSTGRGADPTEIHRAFMLAVERNATPQAKPDILIFTEAEIRARLAELEAERGIEP